MVRINELLSVPADVDWDGDGEATEEDEWFELCNRGESAVDVSGWGVLTMESQGWPDRFAEGDSVEEWLLGKGEDTQVYQFEKGIVLEPGALLVLYRSETGLELADGGGRIILLGRLPVVVDSVNFDALEADASYSLDEDGLWHADWPPSPGAENAPPARPALRRDALRGLKP